MTIEFPPRPSSKEELLSRIRRQQERLNGLLATVGGDDLTIVLQDWSVKDHIAHVTAWLGAARAALRGLRMWEGLGLPAAPANARDWDTINATLYGIWRETPWLEVVARWQRDHESTVAAIEAVSLPELNAAHVELGAPEGRTVMDVVSANTYEHYLEHEIWLREQLAARA
jgi:hypothetical protein